VAVTSLTILSPGFSEFDTSILRPRTSVVWVGGTGPFDILYEWDTVQTFDSGNLVSDLNQGVASPDEGVPPSDLGPFGTDWYLRATIYDLSDTGVDEIQSIYNDATGGTFTLVFLGQETGEIDFDAPDVTVAAEGTLTLDTQPTDGDTFTVDTKTYTFESALTNVDGNIAIGVDLAGSQANLVAAFDLSGVAGTDYATAMTAHTSVDIAAFATNAAVLTAKTSGPDGNSIATTETFNAGTNVFDAATLGTTTKGATGLTELLEAISTITDVTVTGSGTSGDPWLVTFVDPGNRDVPLMTTTDTNLTGHTVGTTIAEDTQGVYPAGTVSPGTGFHILNFIDPSVNARFLYAQANIGASFGPGGIAAEHSDGDPDEFPRFIYANANVGAGFGSDTDGPLGDGEPNDSDRFLYLNANITDEQPCPYLQKIAPTLTTQGGAITLYGDSFGATSGTYQAEVRLYEDQDKSGSYTVLATGDWADTQISAIVPAAATTGWVAVVHTNGLETCVGSRTRLLTIELVPPDPDAGWWLKTANRLNVPTAEHTVQPGNNVTTSFRKIMNSIGSGRLELPLGDPVINDFVDPVTRKGVIVQTFIDKRMRYAWFAENLSHDYDEEGNAVAVISGRGMEVVALWNKLLPHDYPASPTKNPTWIYGSTDNFVQNPGFDDAADNPILSNPGGEDGNDDDGNAEGWSKRGDNVISYTAIQDTNAAMEDDWYIEVEASDNHSGIQQSVSVTPNRTYHVRTYVKDPLASGMRVTLALGGADDIAATGTYGNNFEFGNEILAELDNVARNPSGDGTPGGATNGNWQVLDVEVQTGDEQTSLTISIQNDHHQSGIFNPFWIDHTEIEGWGLGLEPWKAYQPSHHASNSFRLQTVKTYDASPYGLYLNPLTTWAGIEQVMPVNPLTKYTMSLWMFTGLANPDDTFKLEAHKNDGLDTWIGTADEKVPNDNGWTQYQIIFTTDDITEELVLRFVYSGPNNPSPAYVDSVSVVPGEPPSTAGVILNDILNKMNDHGKLTYLGDEVSRTFTDGLDSAGQPWPAALSLDLQPSESLYDVLGRLVALGHEWEIVPSGFAEGGDTGFELNVYTARPFSPESGIGINWINDPEGPVIMPGDATIGGRMLKSAFNVNTVMAIGDDGLWSRVTQYPWLDEDKQPTDPAEHGYRDAFGSIEDVLSVSAGDTQTIAQYAQARLADAKDKERAIQLQMQRSSVIRPFMSFKVGDSLYVDMPPTDPDPIVDYGDGYTRSYPKRIRSIQADLAGEGSDITFQVDIDRVIYEDELAWFATIAQLAERDPGGTSGQGTGNISGTGGAVSVVVGGSTTGDVAPHNHSMKSTEIRDKAASGDVSGSLPGPLTVNAVKGQPMSGAIPSPTTPEDPLPVVRVYDRDTLTWTPEEFEAGSGGGGVATDAASARIYRSAAFSVVDAGTNNSTLLSFDALDYDTGDGVYASGTPTRLTAPADGTYLLNASIGAQGSMANDWFRFQFIKNGTEVIGQRGLSVGGGDWPIWDYSLVVELAADDYIEVQYENRGGTVTGWAGANTTFLSMTQLVGGGAAGSSWSPILDTKTTGDDPPDDEFDSTTLDGKWTAVSGAAGTVNLFETGAISVYDLATREGMLLLQSDTSPVSLRQDYTLADGASIIIAISGMQNWGGDNARIGLSLNDNDTDRTSGNAVHLFYEQDGNGRELQWMTGTDTAGNEVQYIDLGRLYFRIARVGLVYHGMVSTDGMSWYNYDRDTMPGALTNIWITADGGGNDVVPITAIDWIRLGTNDLDPWT